MRRLAKPIVWIEEIAKALDLLPSWADEFDILEKIEELKTDRDFWRTQAEVAWKAYDIDGWLIVQKALQLDTESE